MQKLDKENENRFEISERHVQRNHTILYTELSEVEPAVCGLPDMLRRRVLFSENDSNMLRLTVNGDTVLHSQITDI